MSTAIYVLSRFDNIGLMPNLERHNNILVKVDVPEHHILGTGWA
jgi:hypothetical protein